MKIQMRKEVEIKPVGLPNFVIPIEGDATAIPVWQLSENNLRDIGRDFTERLVEKARKDRERHERG
jgi:hypothetical protein